MTLSQEHKQFTPGNEPTIKFQSDKTVKFQPVVPPPFIPPAPPMPAPAPPAAAAPPAPVAPPAAPPVAPAAPRAAQQPSTATRPQRSAVRRIARRILGPTLMTKKG